MLFTGWSYCCVRYLPNIAVGCGCWGHLDPAPHQLQGSSRALGRAGGLQTQRCRWMETFLVNFQALSERQLLNMNFGGVFYAEAADIWVSILHCVWWAGEFDRCTRAILRILAHGPLTFRLRSSLVHSLDMSSLTMPDNILPHVLGTQTPYRTALSLVPGAHLSYLASKRWRVVLKAILRQPSQCSANSYPKSWFASCLRAFSLPCSSLPGCFLLHTLSSDGAVGSSSPREEEETLAFKYKGWS